MEHGNGADHGAGTGMGNGGGRGRGNGHGAGQGGGSNFDIHDAQVFNLQPLSALKFRLNSSTAADLNETEGAIWDLNMRSQNAGAEVYADAMLNIEALASVRMDGRPPSARDIYTERAYNAVRSLEQPDYIARYERDRASLAFALERANGECSVQVFKDIHQRVLPEKHGATGGVLRQELKQVGGSRYHTFGSSYLMPKPEDIVPLLEDLAAFMSQDDLMVVEQAGIAHGQLINIHPFERGNGKMARAVIHYTLRYRGVAPYLLLPITPVIVTSSHDYVAGINACKLEVGAESSDVGANMNNWLSYFCNSCLRAVHISSAFIADCEGYLEGCREGLNVRSDSAALALLKALPALPAFSAQMAADYLGCSFKRASDACKLLLEAGILQQYQPGKRNRVYFCNPILDAYMSIDALR